MAASIYDDKLIEPTERMLEQDLGQCKPFLDQISSFIAQNYGNLKPAWKFYNKKTGWILKLLSKKRNVIFVVPCQNYFKVAFTFGDKAVNLIEQGSFPMMIKLKLKSTRKYMEGRTIDFHVKTASDLETVLGLIAVKMTKV